MLSLKFPWIIPYYSSILMACSFTGMDRNGPNYRNGPLYVPLSTFYVPY